MEVVGLPVLVIVPEPETNDHCPTPKAGVLAAIVAEFTVTVWSGPALAVETVLTVTEALAVAEQPFVSVTVTV